jgi:hypothetical protein
MGDAISDVRIQRRFIDAQAGSVAKNRQGRKKHGPDFSLGGALEAGELAAAVFAQGFCCKKYFGHIL